MSGKKQQVHTRVVHMSKTMTGLEKNLTQGRC
jgi:hypothetical protein